MNTPTSYSSRVAAEVRATLARHGVRQTDLAKTIGVSANTASTRWRGLSPYTIDELDQIAQSLGIPVSTLIAPAEPMQASA